MSSNKTTLRQYPRYEIYTSGEVVSKRTGRAISTVLDTISATVRLTNRNGKRVRVPVSALVQKAFGAK